MKVLVTGASGCIGAWVVKLLLDRGLDVIAYDLDPNSARLSLIASPEYLSKLRIEAGAIEETERIKDLVGSEGVTHIIHLAGVLMPFYLCPRILARQGHPGR